MNISSVLAFFALLCCSLYKLEAARLKRPEAKFEDDETFGSGSGSDSDSGSGFDKDIFVTEEEDEESASRLTKVCRRKYGTDLLKYEPKYHLCLAKIPRYVNNKDQCDSGIKIAIPYCCLKSPKTGRLTNYLCARL